MVGETFTDYVSLLLFNAIWFEVLFWDFLSFLLVPWIFILSFGTGISDDFCVILFAAPSKTFYWTSPSRSHCGDILLICSAATWTNLWSKNQGWPGKFQFFVMFANWDIGLCLSGYFYDRTCGWLLFLCSFSCKIMRISMTETSPSPSQWC